MQSCLGNYLLMFCLGGILLARAGPEENSRVRGAISLNVRLRQEHVAQDGLRDGDAFTLRTRLGYSLNDPGRWTGFIEVGNVSALDGDGYNQAGLNPGGAGKAVVADPETTELNQLYGSWMQGDTVLVIGRQRLVLDNARFVGDVGWRQNHQTFDALVLRSQPRPDLRLTYAYLDRINRVLGHRHTQGRWSSDSHLLNVSHAVSTLGTLAGYAYLLDFSNAATQSCATFGLSLGGRSPQNLGGKLVWRFEAARQIDYGANPLEYTASFTACEAGIEFRKFSLTLSQDRMGSDRGAGFRTPLATLHAFQGWADIFTVTPASGLQDSSLRVAGHLPGGIALQARYHDFSPARGSGRFGREYDIQLGIKIGAHWSVMGKSAVFRGAAANFPDVQKTWLQVEYVR